MRFNSVLQTLLSSVLTLPGIVDAHPGHAAVSLHTHLPTQLLSLLGILVMVFAVRYSLRRHTRRRH